MSQITKAVILAAGRGTRMRELTDELPKPMIPVKGRPLLEHIVSGLVSNSVTEILIIVGWRKETIIDHFGDGSRFDCRIEYIEQVVQDGTGKVVELARDFSGSDPFILSYGDILVSPESYAPLADFTDVDAKLTVKKDEDVRKGGAVFIGEDNRVTNLIEKPGPDAPTSPYYNAGIYAFSPEIYDFTAKLELSPRGEYELTDAISELIHAGRRVVAVELTGDWADVRDPEVLAELNQEG
jgi:dTDP-glucose pyrophosphorylase